MKLKKYPSDFEVASEEHRPIILINNDKCIFSANDGVPRVWKRIGNTFLLSKRQSQGIMTLEFLLPFSRFNLDSISRNTGRSRRKKIIERDRGGKSV